MSACVEVVSHSKVKIEENNMKIVFLNPNGEEFRKGRIDGCLVKDGIRADYFVCGCGKSILIELKGCNVDHACKQLFAAAEHKAVKPHLTGKLGFLIICSRYPSNSTSVQLAQNRAKKTYGSRFLVYTRERVLSMESF